MHLARSGCCFRPPAVVEFKHQQKTGRWAGQKASALNRARAGGESLGDASPPAVQDPEARVWGEKLLRTKLSKSNSDYPEYRITNKENLRLAALGFMKDWVTAVIGIETAAIGVIGAIITISDFRTLESWEFILIALSVTSLMASLHFGSSLLNMLPAAAQREPANEAAEKNDIYSIYNTPYMHPINPVSKVFRYTFVSGVLLFSIFVLAQLWPHVEDFQPSPEGKSTASPMPTAQ